MAAVLRCYPARWRGRHGDEAAELATLLMRDGTPARSIAWNYLTGAARGPAGLAPGPEGGRGGGCPAGGRGGLGLPLALSYSPAAGAASVTRGPARGSGAEQARAARRLEEMLRSGCLIGEPAAQARAQLRAAHARVTWHGTGFVAAARAGERSGPFVASVFLSPRRPAGHGQGC